MSRTEAAVAGGTRRKTLALAVPLAGLAVGLFLPPVLAGLPLAGQRALIVTLITILLWTGELLEPGVAALVGVTLLALSGATRSLRDALQGFANPVPFFLIGAALVGPGRRAAQGAIVRPRGARRFREGEREARTCPSGGDRRPARPSGPPRSPTRSATGRAACRRTRTRPAHCSSSWRRATRCRAR